MTAPAGPHPWVFCPCGRILVRGATVPAHDRTGRAAGYGGVGRPASGVAGAGGGSVGAVPVARSGRELGRPGCGVPAGLAGVRPAGDHAARVWDRAVALLRWFRFLWAAGVPWDQATRAEARDFSRWIQIAVKPGRAGDAATAGVRAGAAPARAEVPNPVTGKARPGSGYAPATVTHSESFLRGFYDFHCEAGTGPIVNPFPLARSRRGRAHAHHNPMEPYRGERSGRYREPAEHAPHRQVGESHRHEYRQCPTMRLPRSQMLNLTALSPT